MQASDVVAARGACAEGLELRCEHFRARKFEVIGPLRAIPPAHHAGAAPAVACPVVHGAIHRIPVAGGTAGYADETPVLAPLYAFLVQATVQDGWDATVALGGIAAVRSGQWPDHARCRSGAGKTPG